MNKDNYNVFGIKEIGFDSVEDNILKVIGDDKKIPFIFLFLDEKNLKKYIKINGLEDYHDDLLDIIEEFKNEKERLLKLYKEKSSCFILVKNEDKKDKEVENDFINAIKNYCKPVKRVDSRIVDISIVENLIEKSLMLIEMSDSNYFGIISNSVSNDFVEKYSDLKNIIVNNLHSAMLEFAKNFKEIGIDICDDLLMNFDCYKKIEYNKQIMF